MADEHIMGIVDRRLLELGVLTADEMNRRDRERRGEVTDEAQAQAARTLASDAAGDKPLPEGVELPDKFDVSKELSGHTTKAQREAQKATKERQEEEREDAEPASVPVVNTDPAYKGKGLKPAR